MVFRRITNVYKITQRVMSKNVAFSFHFLSILSTSLFNISSFSGTYLFIAVYGHMCKLCQTVYEIIRF